jgi:hypothetical protein
VNLLQIPRNNSEDNIKNTATHRIFLIGLLLIATTACSPIYSRPNRNPLISGFSLTPVAPLTAKLELEISDPDGDPLKCVLSDGSNLIVMNGEFCSSTTGKNYSFALDFMKSGTHLVTLEVEDGRGGNATTSTRVTVQ